MINQTITLTLGGKERTLLFGVNGYYNYIEEATKKDAFEWLSEFDKKRDESTNGMIKIITKDIVPIVYAGLNSQLDSLDLPNESLDKVKKWCNAITPEVAADIFKTAFGTKEQQGELMLQAEQKNRN